MKVQSTKQVQTCPNIEPREKKKEYQPKCIMQTEANNKKTDENWEKNGEVQVRQNFFTAVIFKITTTWIQIEMAFFQLLAIRSWSSEVQ